MSSELIVTTERLCIRLLVLEDAPFILELVNSPGWLQFIGDRNIKTLASAENYLKTGPLQSYKKNGFGLWMVTRLSDNNRIGICGLLKRPYLDDPDVGFAFLPQYCNYGYAFESAQAVMDYASTQLKIPRVVAITNADNERSVRLLHKIGLQFEKTLRLEGGENVQLYVPK